MDTVAEIIAIANRARQDIDPVRSTGKTNPTHCVNENNCYVGYNGDIAMCRSNKKCPVYYNALSIKLEEAGIYKRFQNCNFEYIEKRGVPDDVKEQYAQVKEFAESLKENLDDGKGLLLKGSVGTLKTTLAVAVLQEQIKRCRAGMFITMSSLLDNIFSLKARSQDEWVKYEQQIRETPLLVLDDMGSEHSEGWVLTKVDAIIAERYNRCRSIIVTTNSSNEQLKKTYAERVLDRLRSTLTVVNFSGKSKRVTA